MILQRTGNHVGPRLYTFEFSCHFQSIGSVTIFRRTGTLWSAGFAVPRPPAEDARMGMNVALSFDGSTLAVGGNDIDDVGAVFMYADNGSNVWTFHSALIPPKGAATFGADVAISSSGNTLLVGDYSGGPNNLGTASVYARIDEGWVETATLHRPRLTEEWGASLSISGDGQTIVIGNQFGDVDNVGLVMVFRQVGGNWDTGTLLPRVSPEPFGLGTFGYSVSISADGQSIAVGDPQAIEGGFVSVYRWQ